MNLLNHISGYYERINMNWSKQFGLFFLFFNIVFISAGKADEPVDIGSRRELFVDEYLIQKFVGKAELELHHPTKREVAVVFDEPWEGNSSGYPTIFQDGDLYRMYYRGHAYLLDKPPLRMAHSEVVCYAESKDGIHWVKPKLNLYKWPGVKDNNIIWPGSPESHNFSPFKDTNPDCSMDELYKAVAGTITTKGLLIFKSADGIHWSKISEKPVVTKGAFDSHNTVFWNDDQKKYVMYLRSIKDGKRHISVSYSNDFHQWTEPVDIEFPGSPPQGMYTNQIGPYHRAPHILLGFPTRYVVRKMNPQIKNLEPKKVRNQIFAITDERIGTDLTDGAFITSRDGLNFNRWNEAFLRPGPEEESRWIYGDNYQSYGLWETRPDCEGCPNELSMHFNERSWREGHRVRRYTIRMDGFVSVNAPYSGGEVITRPIRFKGKQLHVNYSTSAAGSLRVEVQDETGNPLSGYSLKESVEHYGDSIDQVISWKNGSNLGPLSRKTIRLRFVLKDGDIYSFQFK